ncbi:MAG: hypothetical protein VX776_09720 [Planctomycetota bacterium]|nr:hypothetical protein [Planctomycetota bacterium]
MKTLSKLWAVVAIAALMTTGCQTFEQHNLPPADQLLHPGPGVDGPGPGVLMPQAPMMQPTAAMGAPAPGLSIQMLFRQPAGMEIGLDTTRNQSYEGETLVTPARYDFMVGANGDLVRMKLSKIPGQEAIELFPTIEIAPVNPRTAAYLDHNAIPVQFTNEDFDQVLTGNYVTKVIYLPDPEFQDLALANVETLVSTRLDPGDDPIVEADRRGSIMAILRMGNKVKAVNPAGAPAAAPAAFMQGAQAAPGLPMTMAPNYVSGLSAPAWGTPMTATNVGVPGPPHLPFGAPAGMQSYTMHNHTKVNLPEPVQHFNVHMRQTPGYSYPKPVDTVRIREHNYAPAAVNRQPLGVRNQVVPQQ